MFDTLCGLVARDTDYPDRVHRLGILNSVLDGTLYDVLPYHFHEERTEAGVYIPLRLRKPNVRYPLCRIVVEDSVALLFSEGHFPTIDSPDAEIRLAFADIIKETRLNFTMIEAAMKGAVGSVALLLRVLQDRVFIDVLDTVYLTPIWDPKAPDRLLRVEEKYKVSGTDLVSNGYEIDEPDSQYWFVRSWDQLSETWYDPVPVGQKMSSVIDTERSVSHKLGTVPIVWIKNLPGRSATGDRSDGACTFDAAMHTQVEIDYQLSQAGRGLKYSSDPTLLLKDPAITEGDLLKGAGNALVVSEKGDARLLEIGGTASAAVIEYVRTLRELALESIHGNRASPERITSAQSGRALELLNQGLVWLADNMRTSYGEGGLLQLMRMIVRASQIYPLVVLGRQIGPLDCNASISLKWPRWYPVSADDRLKDVQSLISLIEAGCISTSTAARAIAACYDIEELSNQNRTSGTEDNL